MKDKRQQKAEELFSVFETRAKQSNKKLIDIASHEYNKSNQLFTGFSVLGPIVLSGIYLIFPIDPSAFVWWKALIDFVVTFGLILCLCALLHKLNTIQAVISKIETSKEARKQKIQQLEAQIEQFEKDQSFYVLATQRIAETIRDGKKDIESLGKTLVSLVFMNLSQITTHNNFTLNLYEKKNNRVKMILSSTRERYIRREDLDNPLLYKDDGCDIDDANIRDYFCVKCMADKIPDENGRYYLHDWVEIAKAFRWNRWGNQKKNILSSRDRQKSKQLGFAYNQYIGFKITRHDKTVVFFEIIANEDAVLADRDQLSFQAYYLCRTYSPLLSILWDIAE